MELDLGGIHYALLVWVDLYFWVIWLWVMIYDFLVF